ncbi:unnamed protein product [Adineta ricciae]|uniref:Uncharacterized protein n=1 Tax=Adineta ricciae TaxID=249248 RepID=A0A816C835_ADIRI|nr:unnamed protein product [Adineta ricciae]
MIKILHLWLDFACLKMIPLDKFDIHLPKSIEQELAEAIQANANLSQQFQQQQHEFQQERQQLGQRIEILPQQL